MALSNWDTLAIGSNGKSSEGEFTFSSGTTVELYKNWAYIANDKMWIEGSSSFTEPTIAQFTEGHIHLGGVELYAKRGKQSGIYLFAKAGYGETLQCFGGIGCYGYGSTFKEYCEQRNIPYEPYDYSSSELVDGEWRDTVGWFGKGKKKRPDLILDKDVDLNPWIGVTKETIADYKKWVTKLHKDEYIDKDWLNSINWDELIRFNQGDAFFAEQLGTDLPASSPEKSNEPIISQAFKNV